MFQVRGEGGLTQGRSHGDGKGQKRQRLKCQDSADDGTWGRRGLGGRDTVPGSLAGVTGHGERALSTCRRQLSKECVQK